MAPGNGFCNFTADPWDGASGLLSANWVEKPPPHALKFSGNERLLSGSGVVCWGQRGQLPLSTLAAGHILRLDKVGLLIMNKDVSF